MRWLDMPIDISDYSDQEALLREIMRQRAALKELTGRPNIARLILRGGDHSTGQLLPNRGGNSFCRP